MASLEMLKLQTKRICLFSFQEKPCIWEDFSTDSLIDSETGLWSAVFINLWGGFSFGFHRAYTYDLIYLIACLSSIGLTLEAHLHHPLQKWNSAVWLELSCSQNKMVKLVTYGAIYRLHLKLLSLFCPSNSDIKSPRIFRGEILECSPQPNLN